MKKRKGVFEYILGGSTDTKLLEVRVFDDATKKAVYAKQKAEAETANKSNCPLCALGHDANKNKIYTLAEMDADHVAAWSKAAGPISQTVRCTVQRIIELKEIGEAQPFDGNVLTN